MKIQTAAQQAKEASIKLAALTTEEKNKALAAIITAFEENRAAIIQANQEDLERSEKENTTRVAINLGPTTGNKGCCESAKGRHTTKNKEETGHPVMMALPKKS